VTHPRIGITLDWEEKGSFSDHPHFALREHYFFAVEQAGGLPLGIPHITNKIDGYLDAIDGLLVPGGFFALDKSWYEEGEELPYDPSPRLQFDVTIMQRALKRDMPVLGICAGMQVMGGIHGSKLTANIHTYLGSTTIDHLNGMPATDFAHMLDVKENTLLHTMVGKTFNTNSHHQEAVVKAGEGVVISAVSADGAVEAIELPKYRFAVGIQSHPEMLVEKDKDNASIFTHFVKAADEYKHTK
jgi:putative glutamine amidotransferase